MFLIPEKMTQAVVLSDTCRQSIQRIMEGTRDI
jgi:hypothetical protein